MGTITLPAVQVQEAARKVIAEILAVRKQRDSEKVQRYMQKRWFNFKRWFHYKTEQEVLEWLEAHSFYGWLSEYRFHDYEHAQKLLKLALHGDPVTLDQEDVEVLFKD